MRFLCLAAVGELRRGSLGLLRRRFRRGRSRFSGLIAPKSEPKAEGGDDKEGESKQVSISTLVTRAIDYVF